MAISCKVGDDLTYALLRFYVRGKALAQTIQDKPFLSWLKSNQETFPGGNQYISGNVQGAFMSDSQDYLQGYSEDDEILFNQAENLLQWEYIWREVSMGLIVSWTELKRDGVTINDDNKVSEHSRTELFRLTKILENRLDDFGESNMRAMNNMCWGDGSVSAKHIQGIRALLSPTADPATGTVGGLSRVTYSWWRHRAAIGANKITASKTEQTLTKKLRSEARQLRRYGGKTSQIFAGSAFIEGLEEEVFEKGTYTQEGFVNEGKTDIGMAKIRMRGVGTFEYDPTMDDIGLSKFAYFLDGRRLKLRPMEGEDMKTLNPTRPYNYLVFLKNVTWTGGMVLTQPNAQGVYEIA